MEAEECFTEINFMTTRLHREHHADPFSFQTHCMSVLGARLYGVKGFAQVTDPICLGESSGARVRNAVPVWFFRTTDERAKAHHRLIQKKRCESVRGVVVVLLCCVVMCRGVLWRVVVCRGVMWRVVALWHPPTCTKEVHGEKTPNFFKTHPLTNRLPPGTCAQYVWIVSVFQQKQNTQTGFAPRIF